MDRLRYVFGIITLAVMAIAGWFILQLLKSDDLENEYQIDVSFLDARGLKAGADVKYRGVQVGSVRSVEIDGEGEQATVKMTFTREREFLVRVNSSFWIVTPRFHGISAGVSGLETLVRDAYVSFTTPRPLGEPLARGSGLIGVEAPLRQRRDVTLPPVERGDLLMRVLLPENHGVSVGARVMFRGMATGEIRSIALAPSGTHVEVQVRVLARFRATVTDASVFWVAKPQVNLQFSFSNPVSVNELGSVLSPYIAYYTPPKTGVPVQDGYPVAALLKRPSIDVTEVPANALQQKPEATPVPTNGVVLVRVVYEAIDVDYLSPNDKLHREGTGMLYVDKKGRTLVVTARSICDAAYFYTETFGERAKIDDEKFAVQLPGSNVLRAARIWYQPDGIDLAVLQVQGVPRGYPTTKSDVMSYADSKSVGVSGLVLHVSGEGGVRQKPSPFDLGKAKLEFVRGGLLLEKDKVVGFVGRTSASDAKPSVVTLVNLPESLRPAE